MARTPPAPTEPRETAVPALERLFTPDEADALIPHLESTFEVVSHHRAQLHAFVKQLEALGVDLDQEVPPDLLQRPEVESLVGSALKEHAAIRAQLDLLSELGVEVKALDGLCDVRSRHDGRVVYLCWRRGESGFHHWHELDTGFAGRQRVMRRGDFEGMLLH